MVHPGGGIYASSSKVDPTVSANTNNVFNSSAISTVYANLQYNTNGTEYTNSAPTSNNFSTSRGVWLDTGVSSDVWVERTINSGAYYTDAGTGRLNLGTTRSWRVRDTNVGSPQASCNADYDFYDAASGGSLLDSVTITLQASYFDPCPTCCFVPGTLVTMDDGSLRPIEDVRVGEWIKVRYGRERVTRVITRTNRPMARLVFADRELVLTEDHPVLVEDKGYSSVNPEIEYKDAGVAKQLMVGDYVVLDSGLRLPVLAIERHPYNGTVYTLENKQFYAGGILVY